MTKAIKVNNEVLEVIGEKHIPCTCDVFYTARGFVSPHCSLHSSNWGEVALEFNQHLLDALKKSEVSLQVLNNLCGKLGLSMGRKSAQQIIAEIERLDILEIPKIKSLERRIEKLESANDMNIKLT